MHIIRRTVYLSKTWEKSGIEPRPIVLRRGEFGDTQLKIRVLGDDGTSYLREGMTVRFCAKYEGDRWIRALMEIEEGEAVYTLDAAFASIEGRAAASYLEISGENYVLPTDTLPVYILPDASSSGDEMSEYKNTVDALIAELEAERKAVDQKQREWDANEQARADAEAAREQAEEGRKDTVEKAEEAVSNSEEAVRRADQAVTDAQSALSQIQDAYNTATGAAEAAKEAAEAIDGVTDDAVAATQAANEIADTLAQKLEAGEFKGDKGDPGDDAQIGDVTATVNTGSVEPKVTVTKQVAEGTVDLEFTFDGFKGDKGDKGDQGDQGDPGKSAEIGEVTASVNNEVGEPSVNVTQEASEEGVVDIDFEFSNLKGDKGDKGDATTLRNVTATVNTLSSVPSVQVTNTPNEDGTADLAFEFNGFKGDKGSPGNQANIGTVTAEVDASSSDKKVDVTTDAHEGTVDLNFKFSGFKGDKGDPGGVSEEVIKQILLRAHPVGSYYWSSEKTSPETLFGGTWDAVEDTFVYAVSTSESAGDTGGAKTVALTEAQMPSHTHTGASHTHSLGSHTHSISNHTHGLNSHTHSVPSHSHGLNSHTHSISHTHNVNLQSTKVPIDWGYSGAKSDLYSYSSGNAVKTEAPSTSTSGAATGSTASGGSGTSGAASGSTASGGSGDTGSASGNTGSGGASETGSAGSGNSHENMPPYVTAYCWKRVA